MPRGWWSARPLRTKGLVAAVLPAVPIIVIWVLIGIAWLQSGETGPSAAARVRETQAVLARIRTERAEARLTGYLAGVAPPTLRWGSEFAQVRARITDAEGVAAADAMTAALQRHDAALTQLRAQPQSDDAREGEAQAYAGAAAAMAGFEAQRTAWLTGETARTQARSRVFAYAFLGGSVLAVAGGLWLSVRVMRSITSRIERVVAGADALSRNEAVDLPDLGADEIGVLAGRLMTILQLLRAREAEVAAKNDDLVAVNKELEAFSYSVSHDLRTPLRAIFGFSQIVEEDAGDRLDPGSLTALRRLRAASERMSVLIDQLLNLSRVARLPVSISRVNLSAVAEEVIAHLRESAPDRQVAVQVQPDIRVDGDLALLRMVMQNLIGNAWKYTTHVPDPRITIGALEGQSTTTVWIEDNGAGFDMARAKHLFGAFQRLHTQREFEGTGIGLAIVQRLIHRHGGQISAHGEVNRGAKFTFVLPARIEDTHELGTHSAG